MSEILTETKDLWKHFGKPHSIWRQGEVIPAVSNVSISIEKGCSVGLVGESGSGKSTLGRMLSGLEKPTKGEVLFRGSPISSFSLKAMRPFRKSIQMIFQNSAGVFDPSYTIGGSIAEVIRNNERVTVKECRNRVAEILEQVGLSRDYARRYGRELSGGQRQRANIARALVLHPEFLVFDEPVSSLDYTLRKQILNLLNRLRESLGLTYLFITHDLNCVPYVCDRLMVMYAGSIVEILDLTKYSMQDAVHFYTRMLLDSVPAIHPENRRGSFCESNQEAMGDGQDTIPRLYEIKPGHLVTGSYNYKYNIHE